MTLEEWVEQNRRDAMERMEEARQYRDWSRYDKADGYVAACNDILAHLRIEAEAAKAG